MYDEVAYVYVERNISSGDQLFMYIWNTNNWNSTVWNETLKACNFEKDFDQLNGLGYNFLNIINLFNW